MARKTADEQMSGLTKSEIRLEKRNGRVERRNWRLEHGLFSRTRENVVEFTKAVIDMNKSSEREQ